jgi:hypothetical protein
MSVMGAAREAGVHPKTPYDRRRTDEAFRRAWNEAADVGTRLLEQEAARRAYHGTLKPVFHKGVECGAVREYSDVLLIFLLKARNPAKYRDGAEDGRGGPFTLTVNIEQVEKEAPSPPALTVLEQPPAVLEQLPAPQLLEQPPVVCIEAVDGNGDQDHPGLR